jgi:hypothetical protein
MKANLVETMELKPVTTAHYHAKQLGISPFTIYYRMTAKYGNKPWSEYTLEEIQSVSKKPRRAMKKRRRVV